MTSICDLPEDVLVELLSLLPAKELVCTCRLVCTQWRYVVDLTTLWKRKCQREGFYLQSLDRNVSDWKIFYMLCSLKRNLIKNPCAEGLFDFFYSRELGEFPLEGQNESVSCITQALLVCGTVPLPTAVCCVRPMSEHAVKVLWIDEILVNSRVRSWSEGSPE